MTFKEDLLKGMFKIQPQCQCLEAVIAISYYTALLLLSTNAGHLWCLNTFSPIGYFILLFKTCHFLCL